MTAKKKTRTREAGAARVHGRDLPLRNHAERALSDYFTSLNGHRPAHLYDLGAARGRGTAVSRRARLRRQPEPRRGILASIAVRCARSSSSSDLAPETPLANLQGLGSGPCRCRFAAHSCRLRQDRTHQLAQSLVHPGRIVYQRHRPALTAQGIPVTEVARHRLHRDHGRARETLRESTGDCSAAAASMGSHGRAWHCPSICWW
jgi:hypothetical protein